MYYDIVVLGVIVSIIFAEMTGFTPAGLVVCGYLVMNLKSSERILFTLVMVFCTWAVVRLIGSFTILYGRRSFAMMVLVSFLLNWLAGVLGLMSLQTGMIGCLVVGIIAREFERQGIWQSLLALAVVTGILALILLLMDHPVLRVAGGL